jgi:carboxymethylenebutenolidase
MKYLTRRIARQGFAAICPDLYAGAAPDRSASREASVRAALALSPARVRRDLGHIVRFITNPTGFWSNAEDGFGVVGFGIGGRGAVDVATDHPGSPLAIVGAPLAAQSVPSAEEVEPAPVHVGVATALAQVTGPLLGIYGREDDLVSIDEVMAARQLAPHGEWVLYEGVGADFYDDDHPGFDLPAQADTITRLTDFFEKHLSTAH